MVRHTVQSEQDNYSVIPQLEELSLWDPRLPAVLVLRTSKRVGLHRAMFKAGSTWDGKIPSHPRPGVLSGRFALFHLRHNASLDNKLQIFCFGNAGSRQPTETSAHFTLLRLRRAGEEKSRQGNGSGLFAAPAVPVTRRRVKALPHTHLAKPKRAARCARCGAFGASEPPDRTPEPQRAL